MLRKRHYVCTRILSCLAVAGVFLTIGPHGIRTWENVIFTASNGVGTNQNDSFNAVTFSVHTQKTQEKVIKILSWTKDRPTYYLAAGFKNCVLPEGKTCEHVDNKAEYESSEVVLFHGRRINPSDMPTYRLPHQKWLFFEPEMPPQTWVQNVTLDTIQDVFNLTSTISMDSDIPAMHRHRTCFVDEEKVKHFSNSQPKTKKVAWFVSHCDTQSKREVYVKELSRFIDVDIYGRCGNYSCGRKGERGDCDNTVLDKDYKFYLSFENSICEHYVTEKLWRILLQPLSVIPVVLGGVDYRKHFPDKTYIDIKEFASPKDLADYLWQLDKNDTLFSEYISRKNALYCRSPGYKDSTQVKHACQVCKYLHEHRNEKSVVENVVDFWSVERRCTSPHIYYKGAFDLSKL